MDVVLILLLTVLFLVGLGWNVVRRAHTPAAPRVELHAAARDCRACHLTEHASWHLSGHAGVDCESCHGPGGAHVQLRRREPRVGFHGAPDSTIASPARLEPQQANALCAGCHAAEADGLRASACHADERLSCGMCHAMHLSPNDRRSPGAWRDGQLAPLMAGDAACLQCHADANPHASTEGRCYDCHMQSRGPRTHLTAAPTPPARP